VRSFACKGTIDNETKEVCRKSLQAFRPARAIPESAIRKKQEVVKMDSQ
jgi:hypothetical protein